jgi:hypothetical protein
VSRALQKLLRSWAIFASLGKVRRRLQMPSARKAGPPVVWDSAFETWLLDTTVRYSLPLPFWKLPGGRNQAQRNRHAPRARRSGHQFAASWFFDGGSALMKPTSQAAFERIADLLRKPRISLANRGPPPVSLELGSLRPEQPSWCSFSSFGKDSVPIDGAPPHTLTIHPVAGNRTAEVRAMNRRVGHRHPRTRADQPLQP